MGLFKKVHSYGDLVHFWEVFLYLDLFKRTYLSKLFIICFFALTNPIKHVLLSFKHRNDQSAIFPFHQPEKRCPCFQRDNSIFLPVSSFVALAVTSKTMFTQ